MSLHIFLHIACLKMHPSDLLLDTSSESVPSDLSLVTSSESVSPVTCHSILAPRVCPQ